MQRNYLDRYVRKVPNFPVSGILFHDIAPLLRDHFDEAVEAMDGLLGHSEWEEIEAIVGVESRGFILASALAQRRHKGFVPVRKSGKLPPPVVSCEYELEYAAGVVEMHAGAGRVLLVDDVLATGGTLRAAANLACRAGYQVKQIAVLISLGMVRDFRWQGLRLRSTIDHATEICPE